MKTLICGLEMSKYSHERWRFELLGLGKDSVKINLSGSLLQDGIRYQQQKNRQHGLVSLSGYVENYSSKISNIINEYRLSSSVCFDLFCKLRWCTSVQFPCCKYEKPILRWFPRNKSYRWILLKLSLNVLYQVLFRKMQ